MFPQHFMDVVTTPDSSAPNSTLQPVAREFATVMLQHPGCLEPVTSASLQLELEQTLQAVSVAVVVDCMGIDAIPPDYIAVLQTAIALAFRLGKELIVVAADPATHAILSRERDRWQMLSSGKRTESCSTAFREFLSRRGCPQVDPSAPPHPIPAKPFIKPPSVPPAKLEADPYTSAHWHPENMAG